MVSLRSVLLALASAVAVSADYWIEPDSVSMSMRSKLDISPPLPEAWEPELTEWIRGVVQRSAKQLPQHLPPDKHRPAAGQRLRSCTSSPSPVAWLSFGRAFLANKTTGIPDIRLRLQRRQATQHVRVHADAAVPRVHAVGRPVCGGVRNGQPVRVFMP